MHKVFTDQKYNSAILVFTSGTFDASHTFVMENNI